MNHTQSFIDGYSDAYFGKDNTDKYGGVDRIEYLKGRDLFLEEFCFDVYVMQELNG